MKISKLVHTFSLYLLACIFTTYMVNMHHVSSQCLDDESSMLIEFRSSVEVNPLYSTKLVSWEENTDCCVWSGVTCDPSNGRVIGLDLSDEGIMGGIDNSSTLFQIQSLESLNLAYNLDMNGTIPPALGKLTNLTHLNMSYTGFTGQLPIEISYLVNLVTLDISFCSSSSNSVLYTKGPDLKTILERLANLRELHLDDVNISVNEEEWGDGLSSLLSLQVLSMSSCNLSGDILEPLEKLPSLSVIRLDSNNISSPLPESVGTITNLETLTLSRCGLTGIASGNIWEMPKLTTLDLSYNDGLKAVLPDSLHTLSLETLQLSHTQFSGTLPDSIGNLKRLQKLDLSNCNFDGTIPSTLGSLSRLESLDLSSNTFSGPIPSFSSAKNLRQLHLSRNAFNGSITSTNWEGLLNLEDLDLSRNSLSDSIPASLFSAPSLWNVRIGENKFSGPLKLSKTTTASSKLTTLDVSLNNLEGPIPNSIFELQDLHGLYLDGNRFNGSLDLNEILGKLNNLMWLYLSNNLLSVDTRGNPATINSSSFPQLLSLELASCKLGAFPELLKTQTCLQFLDLSNNQINGTVPRWVWNTSESLYHLNLSSNNLVQLEHPIPFSSVKILDLHGNNIQGELPFLLSDGIQYLDWSSNNFTSIDPAIGSNLFSAVFLSLARNNIYGKIPVSLCNATIMEVLDLEYNNFMGTIPDCLISRLDALAVFNARGNSLSGVIPDVFANTCQLQTLNFNDNALQGTVPRSLARCKELEVLDLGNNQLVDLFPCQLTELPNLHVLILRSNKLHGTFSCSKQNSMWPLLQILDLASNHLNGTLKLHFVQQLKFMLAESQSEPTELYYRQPDMLGYYQDAVKLFIKGNDIELQKIRTTFTNIDLSNNVFHGEIPPELGNLSGLVFLNLSDNSLSGNIPASFGNMRQLESLDLACNALSGEIPKEFSNLNFLGYLNLSFNKLNGPIPISTQLQSFNASSYEGNQGLYGPPLTWPPNPESWHGRGVPQTITTDGSHWSSKDEVEWMLRGFHVGLPVGLTIFIGPILYIKRWRQWYCGHLGRFIKKFLHKEDKARGTRTSMRRHPQRQRINHR